MGIPDYSSMLKVKFNTSFNKKRKKDTYTQDIDPPAEPQDIADPESIYID